jgi:hypothetical protein
MNDSRHGGTRPRPSRAGLGARARDGRTDYTGIDGDITMLCANVVRCVARGVGFERRVYPRRRERRHALASLYLSYNGSIFSLFFRLDK